LWGFAVFCVGLRAGFLWGDFVGGFCGAFPTFSQPLEKKKGRGAPRCSLHSSASALASSGPSDWSTRRSPRRLMPLARIAAHARA
jgi:hypothetical protein